MAYNVTSVKLAEFTDPNAFERMCCALLVREYPRIVPLGGSGDSGRDAIEPAHFSGAFAAEGGLTIFQFTVQKTWKRKLDDELAKVFKNGFRPSIYVFVSNQIISTEAVSGAQNEMKNKYGVDVRIYPVTWLQARLESPDYLQVRRQYLGLDETSLQAFLTHDEYESRRLDRNIAPDLPAFAGREREVDLVRQFVGSNKRLLLLAAPPGTGKTKLLLEAARSITTGDDIRFLRPEVVSIEEHLAELDPKKPLTLFVDDAHEVDPLKQLIALLVSPEFRDQIHCVVATHPWGKEQLLREFQSRGVPCEAMDLPNLSATAINDILQHQSVGLAHEQQRGIVIKLAEGNPLVALLAADVLKQTGSLAGLSKHEVLTAYFAKSLDTALGSQTDKDKAHLFLAIISATRGTQYGQSRPMLAELVGWIERGHA